jgi:hypothetical protein
VHNSRHHSAKECRKIKKLMEQFREQQKQQSLQDDTPPRQQDGKQEVAHEGDGEAKMEFQNAKRPIKVVYGQSDFKSSDNEHCKQLHIMYGGSWDITSWHVIKMLCWAVVATAPTSRAAPQHKWMETSITFDASDCPKNMAGAG